jgi:hypothetical protein
MTLADDMARDARLGHKALKKLFGRAIADKVRPHQRYWLCFPADLTVVVPGERYDEFRVALWHELRVQLDGDGRNAPGYRLGTLTSELDAVVHEPDELVDLVWKELARQAEGAAAGRASRLEAARAAHEGRTSAAQRRKYGTVVE